MSIDPRKLKSLELLAEGVRPLFPAGVEFHRAPDAPRNFFLDWPLANQPDDLTQTSRTVSIYFSDQFLEQLSSLSAEDLERHISKLHALVKERMRDFDDGSKTIRYRVKEAFVIDLTEYLTI
ncbi:hypothetical protein [Caballeronia pedi]|uniref:hypothetical protein n=1 Tax=Caballeronia pedi TaxID=1777141 RepID=UPI001178AD19|nr:hypothetical protein [Caballeronia pedi]